MLATVSALWTGCQCLRTEWMRASQVSLNKLCSLVTDMPAVNAFDTSVSVDPELSLSFHVIPLMNSSSLSQTLWMSEWVSYWTYKWLTVTNSEPLLLVFVPDSTDTDLWPLSCIRHKRLKTCSQLLTTSKVLFTTVLPINYSLLLIECSTVESLQWIVSKVIAIAMQM